MADSYIDLAIRRQAILERLKSGEVVNFAREIAKVEKLIRRAFADLEGDISGMSRTRLNAFMIQLQKDQAAIFSAGTQAFLKRTADIAAVYMAQELLDLKNTVDVRGTRLNDFTKKDLFKKVIQRPLSTDGDLLEPWIKDFTNRETYRVTKAIRAGHSRGLTNQELVQKLIGTKARKYKDGILQTTRRNGSTIVRTSVQHVASSARHEVWEGNPDVVSRYRFLATLDATTSPICRSLDQQEFDFGQGPIPPVHPNCRSTTIPVLNPKFSFLEKGRTRSGEEGPVGAGVTFYGWLRTQPVAKQRDVLGVTRAKLFANGGLSAERFRQLQFDKNFAPLTLAEMSKLEPEAFKRAGLLLAD